ncbi:MAG: tetratricopeptide repeat protein [Planctomycetes bacterium]|nr:tetratricopeptide repeat protein [Planctomycetota bacterium]
MRKEPLVFGVSGLVMLACLFLTARGWERPSEWRPNRTAGGAETESAPIPTPATLDSDFTHLWDASGGDPFTSLQGRMPLPPSILAAPVPSRPAPILPPPQPRPDFAAWPTHRYPSLAPGATRVAAEALPPMDALQSLIGAPLQTPPPAPPERKPDLIFLRNGGKVECEVLFDGDPAADVIARVKGQVSHYPRSNILRIERVFTPAQQVQEQSRKLARDDASGRYKLAQFALEQGLSIEARRELEQVVAANPKHLDAVLALGCLLREAMDLDGELRVYRRAVSVGIGRAEEVYARLADLYESMGLRGEAVRACEQALGLLPTHAGARARLARSLLGQGDVAAASAHCAKARSVGAESPEVQGVAGLIALRQGDFAAAQASLKAATAAPGGASDLWSALGVASWWGGDPAAAGAAFQRAIITLPSISTGWVNLGLLHLAAGRYSEADALLREAFRRDPASADALAGLGALAVAQQKWTEADASFAAALEIAPDHVAAAAARAWLALQGARPAEAEPLALAAARADFSHGEAIHLLGIAQAAQGRFREAVSTFSLLASRDRNRPGLHAALAAAYAGVGELDFAEAALKAALEVDPADAEAKSVAACLEYLRGNLSEAQRKFEALQKSGAGNAYVTSAIARIQDSAGKVMWEDHFERADRAALGRGWTASDKFGVHARIASRRVRFSGTQSGEDWGQTTIDQPADIDLFVSAEADLDPAGAEKALSGIHFVAHGGTGGGGKAAAFLGRTERGKIAWCIVTDGDKPSQWTEAGDVPAGPLTLSIERTVLHRRDAGFQFRVNGHVVAETKVDDWRPGGRATVGVFGAALKGQEWSLDVRRFRMVERKKEDRH